MISGRRLSVIVAVIAVALMTMARVLGMTVAAVVMMMVRFSRCGWGGCAGRGRRRCSRRTRRARCEQENDRQSREHRRVL